MVGFARREKGFSKYDWCDVVEELIKMEES